MEKRSLNGTRWDLVSKVIITKGRDTGGFLKNNFSHMGVEENLCYRKRCVDYYSAVTCYWHANQSQLEARRGRSVKLIIEKHKIPETPYI